MTKRFVCEPDSHPGLIGKDLENPQWFGFSGGAHFFMRSLHVGDCFFADNWPDESRHAFLDWAQEQGYNTLSIASFFVNRQTYRRGMGWNTPKLWPLDALEYQRAERILDDLAARELVVFPFAGFFGREGFNPTAHRDQQLCLRYILARWGSYWNLLYNVAGPEPLHDTNPFMPRCELDKLGLSIQREDAYGHLLTVHNQTGNDQFALAPYKSFTTLQGPKTVSLQELSKGLLRNHAKDAPLYAQETLWTDNIYGHPRYTDEQLRKNAYVIALSAAALNFGDMNGDSSSGFSGQPELNRRVQRRHDIVRMVWDAIMRFPYYEMTPRPNWVKGAFCLASPKQRYLVYIDSMPSLSIVLPEASGGYRAQILHADCPEDRVEVTLPSGSVEWPLCDTRDYLIYIECVEDKTQCHKD